MFLLQSFWGDLNFIQWSENLVGEFNLNCGLDAFEYEIGCVANDGMNRSIGAASSESIGAACFEEHTEHCWEVRSV